ncbi:probable E3 ubiquitin-protein ligase ATL45 [Phragmites australis]|uniref:probable E3 ubiquitin-protein ligase ATL45 n=1 Tax=Phragmites australis TaxID=29695 RepID=UPI002D77C02C|nr:probable E3 ubiquitin-protein ligase ATL45 [Phragmites australis]
MISPDRPLALLIVVALVVVSLGIAVAAVHCCLNRDQDDDAQLPEELEVAPSAQPPPVEAVQMASMAMILLDYVTYPRQNASASASASASAGGGDRSTEASGRTSASEDCAICLGPFEDGDWCSVMPMCRHEFHQDCIADWLMAYNNSCPLCRAQLQWLDVAQGMV